MENIEWDKLQKKRMIKIEIEPLYKEKILPEGVFVCPHCYGSGEVIDIHRFRGSHKYMKCGMCRGFGEIVKCDTCHINPVPNFGIGDNECVDCHELRVKEIEKKFLERNKIRNCYE